MDRKFYLLKNGDCPDIIEDGREVIHYDDDGFRVFVRRNHLPAFWSNPDMTMHFHGDLEFISIIKGELYYQLNGQRILMKQGQGIFVNSDQLHVLVTSNVDCILDCLIINPMMLCASKTIEEKYIASVREPFIFLDSEIMWQGRVLSLMDEIYRLSCLDNAEFEILMKIYELWNNICKNCSRNETGCDEKLVIVKKMLEYIYNNYQSNISLDEICSCVGVSRTECNRLFNKFIGMSPVSYVIDYRISKSLELLDNTDKGITEIALEVGFNGGGYFTKVFREKTQMTPMAYRKRERI